jgi:Golgi SNAP receptor complex protein 1
MSILEKRVFTPSKKCVFMAALASVRSQARKLENEIDSKLVQLSRFDGSAAGSASFPQLQRETAALIQQLGEVNDMMSREATGGGATGGTATAMHMLQRHREILHDFQQEFNKCKASVKASTERDQLLSSVRQDIREHRCKEATNSETQLRERNAIQGADRGAEDVLSVAHATREALAAQRSTFGGMSSKLTQLSAIAPQVDALLGRIGLRKKRDKMILAVVVGLCSGLLFVSAFG